MMLLDASLKMSNSKVGCVVLGTPAWDGDLGQSGAA